MVDYKRILQLDALGVSQRGIADTVPCSRNTVATALASARTLGIAYEQVADLDAVEVRRLLMPERLAKMPTHVVPDFEWVHREMAKPNVTLTLVWSEYATATRNDGGVPFKYTAFNDRYRAWVRATGSTMRIHRKPGESIEVDWAGDTMTYLDPLDGAKQKAYLFVAALPYSAYMFVTACPDMTLASWINAHIAAFEFFGGTARLLIPDNLRAGVSKADRYESALNPSYAQLAEHYGTAVIPARVRKPKDKPVGEGSVRFGANVINATLRHRTFIGLGELNEAIAQELEAVNAKAFQKRPGSRVEVFTREEAPLLRSLPAVRFELAEQRKAKPGPNYHIQVLGNFYSVPHALIGRQVDVRVTTRMVEVFDDGVRVASHTRAYGKGEYRTVTAHMPPAHRAHLSAQDWTPERFVNWAAGIGPATRQVIEAILVSKPVVEQAYRSCLGVMALAKKDGGALRLEDTCAEALALATSPSYTLVKRLWGAWKPAPAESKSIGEAGFVRGGAYFARQHGTTAGAGEQP